MEEESWASCGNRDYLTPWDLFPCPRNPPSCLAWKEKMDHLAILEVLPSCVWISFSMCLHLCCLNFPSTSSWTKSWSQSLLHVVVATFNSLLSHCCRIFTNFFFQFPEQNLYWNIAPLRSARIFLSNESLFAQNWFRTRELCPFYPSAAICPDEFQNAQRPMFLPYLRVRVFKFIDLECVGMGIWWSFWISTFCILYSS